MPNVLTVDASTSIRETIKLTLEPRGYDIHEATSGHEAISSCVHNTIDLVITTLDMPDINGIELIKHLRADPGYAQTPILMLTTDNTPEKKMAGREAGATGWILKPFDPDKLQALVDKICPNS